MYKGQPLFEQHDWLAVHFSVNHVSDGKILFALAPLLK